MELFFTLNSAGFKFAVSVCWRSGKDSNLRTAVAVGSLAGSWFKPLTHHSRWKTLARIYNKKDKHTNETNEHNNRKLGKGSLYWIEGKKALTNPIPLDRVKNSLNAWVFCSIHCQKYIEIRNGVPQPQQPIYTKRKELNEHLELRKLRIFPWGSYWCQ